MTSSFSPVPLPQKPAAASAANELPVAGEAKDVLRAAFALLIPIIIMRYTKLVGWGMASSLMYDLNDLAQHHNWKIQISSSSVTDTQLFETTNAAAEAYRLIIREIWEHINEVVGGRMANSIVREAISQLNPSVQAIVKTYRLTPEQA